MMLALYRTATTLAAPLIRLYLARRMARGKEDPARFSERLGRPGRPRPAGPLIWLHAASVGESLSLLPLTERLLQARPGVSLLVTTGSVTSARLMGERLPAGAFHQFLPVDRPAYVRRFLDHWQPDLVLWAESEFWPNMVSTIAQRRIPLVLINGRVSARSFAGWHRWRGLIHQLLTGFVLCLGQTEEDAERLRALGAPEARCVGNLKFAAPPLSADAGELAMLENLLADRPVWVAASTHAGEEEIAGQVQRALAQSHAGLLTLIVPRHPERGPGIAADLRAGGLTVAVRSADAPIENTTDIYVADTLGELGLFFRLADVVFMGKSLTGEGGQNLLEPGRLGKAILHGPRMSNFAEMSARMKAADAAIEVADAAALRDTVDRLLGDAAERDRLGPAAQAFAEGEAGVLERLMDALAPWLPEGDSHAGS